MNSTAWRTLGAVLVAAAVGGAWALPAAADNAAIPLTLKNHQFEPPELEIPAGAEVRLLVTNADDTPAEFESHDLDVEKVIPGGQQAEIVVGPLEPGTYEFVDEFNEDTAKGRIVVK